MLNVRFTTNGKCAKNNTIYTWRERLKNDLGDLELHEVPVFRTNSVAFCRVVCQLCSTGSKNVVGRLFSEGTYSTRYNHPKLIEEPVKVGVCDFVSFETCGLSNPSTKHLPHNMPEHCPHLGTSCASDVGNKFKRSLHI